MNVAAAKAIGYLESALNLSKIVREDTVRGVFLF
jgi:hypothetical protein